MIEHNGAASQNAMGLIYIPLTFVSMRWSNNLVFVFDYRFLKLLASNFHLSPHPAPSSLPPSVSSLDLSPPSSLIPTHNPVMPKST